MTIEKAADERFETSYADFSLGRVFRQLNHLIRSDHESGAQDLLEWVQEDEKRLAIALGVSDVAGKKILEIGPGQNLERAWYYGKKNEVVGVDLDVVPIGWNISGYYNMLRQNGMGRFAKTVGRNILINPKQSRAWAKAIGVKKPSSPQMYYDDFCTADISDRVPGFGTYDAVTTWSVFEHLADPKTALSNVVKALKPGGALLISLHLYTSNYGHHDIRAFTGKAADLPHWGHLRPNHKDSIYPSAYLNEWRLHQYREIFDELAPGYTEYLDMYEHPEVYGPEIKGQLAEELKDYSLDELLTVNVVYAWQKPYDA
ncbi:MAG: methyltransferase domain-containing protein [Chloroflexota bacterium]